jgi:hypothetical protein
MIIYTTLALFIRSDCFRWKQKRQSVSALRVVPLELLLERLDVLPQMQNRTQEGIANIAHCLQGESITYQYLIAINLSNE